MLKSLLIQLVDILCGRPQTPYANVYSSSSKNCCISFSGNDQYIISIAQLDTHTTYSSTPDVMIWLVNAVHISSFYRHVDCDISARVSVQYFEGTLHHPQKVLYWVILVDTPNIYAEDACVSDLLFVCMCSFSLLSRVQMGTAQQAMLCCFLLRLWAHTLYHRFYLFEKVWPWNTGTWSLLMPSTFSCSRPPHLFFLNSYWCHFFQQCIQIICHMTACFMVAGHGTSCVSQN